MSCKINSGEISRLQVIYLENENIRVGILVDRGSDVCEFYLKQAKLDVLLRLDKGIVNPREIFSQRRDTTNQFEDYYYGGWQICLPNSFPMNYKGAELGQHGEVALIPWNYSILEETSNSIQLKTWVRPLRFPIEVERIFSITKDSYSLKISEEVKNLSDENLDIMWGQHIAFGKEFIKDGCTIDCDAKSMYAEPCMSKNTKFKRGVHFEWPWALDKNEKMVDASKISEKGKEKISELSYLENFPKNAFYLVRNIHKGIGFKLKWDAELFKTLWMWQEYNATLDFPWWGNCYTLALEPWTSVWANDPDKAIQNNEWLVIEGNASIKTEIEAEGIILSS